MPDTAYLNGEIMPLAEARIAATDYGFLFGYGLYETLRAYRGRLFRLNDHLDRLEKAAGMLKIPWERLKLERAVKATVSQSGIAEARVRITLTAGEGSLTPDPGTCRNPTVFISVITYNPPAAELYQRGYRAVMSTICRNSRSQLPGMKTSCFLESMLARQAAREVGANDAILLNDKGELAEASSSNIFLVSRGIPITPALESGILPGVTRKIVLELAEGLGIRCERTIVEPQELYAADEAFITNSLIEIIPLTVIDSRPVGAGIPGPLTLQLMAAYRDLVDVETQ